MRRFVSAAQFPRRRLQIRLVPRHDRHIDPFAGQFPRDGFADAPTAAGHDRMLALQSEVHGILSPCRRASIPVQPPRIVLPSRTGAQVRRPVGKIAGATYRDGQNRRLAI